MDRTDVTALIVAGGKATRMGGAPKHAIAIEGETILARQRRVLEPRVAEVIVSVAAGGHGDFGGLRTVEDLVADAGPVAGIAAGLAAARTPWVVVVACDLPDVSAPVVDLLLQHVARDGCALRIDGRAEPLLCVLHARVAAVARGRVETGQLRGSALLEALDLVWLDETALRAVDPELRSLHNINAPADMHSRL